jgi:methionyl-tRNA synthetase
MREQAKSDLAPAASGQPSDSMQASSDTAGESGDDTISIDDFRRVDLRVARVVAAHTIEGADKLLRLELDLGGPRRSVLAGVRPAYAAADVTGRLVIVVANLAPRRMRFGTSEGMVLATGEGEAIRLIAPATGAQPGDRVT